MKRIKVTIRRWGVVLAVLIALGCIRDELAGYLALTAVMLLAGVALLQAAEKEKGRPRW